MKESYHITSDRVVAELISVIATLSTNGRYKVTIEKTARTRTLPQNRSLHLYLTMMAKAFNDAGIDIKIIMEKFKKGFSISVTDTFLKEVFHKIMGGMFNKTSTADLTTIEMQEVYEVFNMGMGEKFGVSKPWPCKEDKEKPRKKVT